MVKKDGLLRTLYQITCQKETTPEAIIATEKVVSFLSIFISIYISFVFLVKGSFMKWSNSHIIEE